MVFPILSPSPLTQLIGASENPPPIAPPIILNPLICFTTSGKVAKSNATFVNAPVATSQGVPSAWAKRAYRIAIKALPLFIREAFGSGRRSVPSIPVIPMICSQVDKWRQQNYYESIGAHILPWISGACTACLQNGFIAPAYTDISSFPIAVSTLAALAVVRSRGAFP